MVDTPMSVHHTHGPNNRPLNSQGNPAPFETDPQYAGRFNPDGYKPGEVEKALQAVRRQPAYRTDPFAVGRAFNLMQRGIYRPQDIIEGVSV